MYLVLSLPIPSTPYLVYLAIYETLIDFGVIYVLASTLFILSYFFLD